MMNNQNERMTMSDLTDWAASINSLGAPDKEGLIVLPATEGRFTVHYHEYCVFDDPKHRRAIIDRSFAAMHALHKFLTAHNTPFYMYLYGTQPRYMVNGAKSDHVDPKRLRYFYSLHMDAVINRHTVRLSEDFMSRSTDDGK